METGYTIKEMKKEDFLPLFNKHHQSVFEGTHSYLPQNVLNDTELKKLKTLGKNIPDLYTLYLAAFDKNDQFIGWCWGFQESRSTFYMVNSGVLPQHRCKGVYSGLVKKCLNITGKKGYQIIYSRHCVTNNAVIIPKLKAGFTISKMEINDMFGVLVHLTFYTNKIRRKIINYRAGQLKPDKQIKKLFNI